jgi:hypothetical protein
MVFNATFNNNSVISWQFYYWRKPLTKQKGIWEKRGWEEGGSEVGDRGVGSGSGEICKMGEN